MKLLWLPLCLLVTLAEAAELPDAIRFEPGALNSATIQGPDGQLVVYGSPTAQPDAETVLLTHVRRDLASFARSTAESTEGAVAPAASEALLTEPEQHWNDWWDKRYNYYGQQSTRLPILPLKLKQTSKDGDTLKLAGLEIEVMELPGYTTDMLGYLFEMDGQRILFSGDLLLAGGKVADLYSFQDAIPEAKVGAYHGYGARFPLWIESLRKVAALQPDVMVPLRGPLITNPKADIDAAIQRVQAIYSNYLSTNALHWYFGPERLGTCGKRVLGEDAEVELMPFAEHIELPSWCQHIRTTKLLVSADKHGFALDVGGKASLDSLKQALADGLIAKLDGIWVTHTHNDHTAFVQEAAAHFKCPVYAVEEVADVLEKPGAWFLPGTSENVVPKVKVLKDGEAMSWKEFQFTAHFFPGQMYNHGGLLVERQDHEPVFFIGDSFSPSGLDDYCMLNRNLMREDTGYFLCLQKVRSLPTGSWLVNQHIPHLFRFTSEELDYLESRYRQRQELIGQLVAWDDPNYGIDEQWAWIYPYGTELKPGSSSKLQMRLWNHSEKDRTYTLTFHAPEGISITPAAEASIPARGFAEVAFRVELTQTIPNGIHVITASVSSSGEGLPSFELPHWSEALIRVVED